MLTMKVQYSAFMVPMKSGKLAIFQRRGRNLKATYILQPEARITPRPFFFRTAMIKAKTFPTIFATWLDRAIGTRDGGMVVLLSRAKRRYAGPSETLGMRVTRDAQRPTRAGKFLPGFVSSTFGWAYSQGGRSDRGIEWSS